MNDELYSNRTIPGGGLQNVRNGSSSSSAAGTLNTMSRLVMDDQVTKGLTDYVRCGICFQVLTSDRKPVECD